VFAKAVAKGQSAAEEDLAFHLAIARATRNGHFEDFLRYLGKQVIPRQRIRTGGSTIVHSQDYLDQVADDHAAIAAAIAAGDRAKARDAMAGHLGRAIARYKDLAARADAGR
jgi:DNA-binding FadR family transcriptional regulator